MKTKEADITSMTDLELLDYYIVGCQRFVNPEVFGEVNRRGLIRYVNFLPTNIQEAKAVLRSRLSQNEKFWGDGEIDKIAGEIESLKRFKNELDKIKITEVDEIIPILEKMLTKANYVKDYLK
jgi:hypothetical protein